MNGMEGDDPAIPRLMDGTKQTGEHSDLVVLGSLTSPGEVKSYLADEGSFGYEGLEMSDISFTHPGIGHPPRMHPERDPDIVIASEPILVRYIAGRNHRTAKGRYLCLN